MYVTGNIKRKELPVVDVKTFRILSKRNNDADRSTCNNLSR